MLFNFLNKKNERNNDNCYLLNSGVLDQKILDDDKLEYYKDLLKDKGIPDFFKDVIRFFLIPYKISLLKYTFNKEYFEDPFPIDFQNDHKHIAPSLKKLKEHQYDLPLGYPSWFIVAFSDVALWAIKGEGINLILKRYESLTEEEVVDGRYINGNLLNDIIKLYQKTTNKPLECKKY